MGVAKPGDRMGSVRQAYAAREARAKINLALHVTGRRADGYHEIDTLVGFASIGDHIRAEPYDGLSLAVTGPFAAGLSANPQDNLAMRAARLLAEAATDTGHAVSGARLTLDKRLPIASGMGGGSADAAATLLALARLWALPDDFDLTAIAVRLGADVAMCLQSRPLRARGIGEIIKPVLNATSVSAILVNPRVELPTPAVFGALSGKENPRFPNCRPIHSTLPF